jgi:hypothetical protein
VSAIITDAGAQDKKRLFAPHTRKEREMEKPQFSTSLQFSTRDINHGAVLMAAGYYVEIVRQPGSRRCIFYADDTVETRALIDSFERRECISIPPKAVLHARTELYHMSDRVARGAADVE